MRSFRTIRPTFVIRSSSCEARRFLFLSASTIMVRNFSTWKIAPSLVTRGCLKKTGPPSSSLMARASMSMTGLETISATTETRMSSARFKTLCSKVRPVTREERTVTSSTRTWWECLTMMSASSGVKQTFLLCL